MIRGVEIKAAIEDLWTAPSNYFHLRKGGHVKAARLHQNAPAVASIDLKKFFDQISRTKVHRALKAIGFSHEDAWDAACDSTVDKRPPHHKFSIPFGFVQSPIIASVVLARSALGKAIRNLRKRDINVSVYVDDITISGDTLTSLESGLTELGAAAELSGLHFNPEKTQLPNSRVTSFNIEFGSGSMSVVQARIEKFEAALRDANEYQAAGILGYVGSVNQMQCDHLSEARFG